MSARQGGGGRGGVGGGVRGVVGVGWGSGEVEESHDISCSKSCHVCVLGIDLFFNPRICYFLLLCLKRFKFSVDKRPRRAR